MGTILEPKHLAFEAVYEHYHAKVENGRFAANKAYVQILLNHVLDRNLGCPVASSYTGIGGDITNGFVQFIVDNPYMFTELNCWLVNVMDRFTQCDRPSINIRSKTLPKEFITDNDKQYITVMLRTPKFRDMKHANSWWEKLALIVQSYSS